MLLRYVLRKIEVLTERVCTVVHCCNSQIVVDEFRCRKRKVDAVFCWGFPLIIMKEGPWAEALPTLVEGGGLVTPLANYCRV
jgi:hypothetical protein